MKSSFISIATCLVASPALAQAAGEAADRPKRDTIIVTGKQLEKETDVSGRLRRGRNLTDEFYADWSSYASGLLFIGAPRCVELSFRKRL